MFVFIGFSFEIKKFKIMECPSQIYSMNTDDELLKCIELQKIATVDTISRNRASRA